MKKKNLLMTAIAIFGLATIQCAAQNPCTYSIGSIGPAGGYIFYDKGNNSNGWRYLEAAPNHIGGIPWGCFGTFTNLTADSIGSGLNNTQVIGQACGPNNATQQCLNYTFNGYSDWFLPSIDELVEMFTNLWANGIGNFNAPNGQYWSSSDFSSEGARIVSIDGMFPPNFNVGDDNKNWSDYVIPCRMVSGEQPAAPTLACYETLGSFNNTTCSWDVSGTQPAAPTLACYETLGSFNNTTCQWDVTGSPASVSQPTNQTITVNNNAQFVVGSSDPGATYQWQTDLGVGFQNLNSVGQYSGTTNDTLTVSNVSLSNNNQPFRCIVSSGSCSDTSNVAVLTVNNNVGIIETSQDKLFSVFPNPTQSVINVKADGKLIGSVYSIYDNTGRIVLTGKLNSENTTIELGNLSGGIYMLSVGKNMKQTFKVIKE